MTEYKWSNVKEKRSLMFDYISEVKKIRIEWAENDRKRDMHRTTPKDIKRCDNISYGPYGVDNLLDIYIPCDAVKPMPTIVNTHGGAWVYGSKEVYQYYCMDLALRGFTVVNINYRLAPEYRFPTPLIDLNAALSFIAANSSEYYIDKDNIILIGDSAGGQITSNYAAVFTNREYASLLDIKVPDIKIKALGLNCGCYNTKKLYTSGEDSMYCGYIGINADIATDELLCKLDVYRHITKDFPPSFIISAQNDFLLPEATPMYELLKGLGVDAELKIYGTKEQEEVGHVFPVNIDLEEATTCNDDQAAFFLKYCND